MNFIYCQHFVSGRDVAININNIINIDINDSGYADFTMINGAIIKTKNNFYEVIRNIR